MTTPPLSTTVFGLSSEGYQIALTLTKNHIPTIIIDENLKVGMELKPEDVENYTSIQALQEGEPLLRVKPFEKALSESKYIFFVPKIRSFGEEVKIEINSRLRELAKYLPKGSTLINSVPTGIGGNLENIRLIERISGFKWCESFYYVYCPFIPCSKNPIVIGFDKPKMDKELLEILQLA
ncbi:MAG: hypothetical protein QXW83_03485, partial [Nitrososphaerales archaeon]